MKTDVIKITSAGEGTDAAFSAVAASATYRDLTKKEALHLRLLTEEMVGMLKQITGKSEAEFWVESNDKKFELHLLTHPAITEKMREDLIKVSTSGKNSAAKGFMGKLRDIIDRALLSNIGMETLPDYYTRGLLTVNESISPSPMVASATASRAIWSMMNYKTSVEAQDDELAKEEWDELEKSIVAKIADEVKIAITGDRVEMTVYKTFA